MSPRRSHPTLSDLLVGIDHTIVHAPRGFSPKDLVITDISIDSRRQTTGALFIALAGVVNDGHQYIESGVAGGCVAVLCLAGRIEESRLRNLEAVVVEVADTNLAYALAAANYFQRPAEKLSCTGVTGTNGKTTVTYLLERIFLENGWNVGVIGTVNIRYTLTGKKPTLLDTRFTTPEAFILQKVLREMVDAGVDHVIMEVSSHALAQARVGGIVFESAAFTNLTRDHLDYHADMAGYFQAKEKLFSHYLGENGRAVLPCPEMESKDWEWLRPLYHLCSERKNRVIGWGENVDAEVHLEGFETKLLSTYLKLRTPTGSKTLTSPLVGRFNVDNLLTTFALALAMHVEEAIICRALSDAAGAPGRMQRVSVETVWPSHGPVVLVDYAHTPDALEKVLQTAKGLPHRRLFCLFGCGGDRDKGKRPTMGAIAARLADVVVVTDDNPRTEDPDAIISQILSGIEPVLGMAKDGDWLLQHDHIDRGHLVIRDRRDAIEQTIRAAGTEDIVVIAGKGHETYQLTLQGKRFFDDRREAENALLSWTAERIAAAVGGTVRPGLRGRGLLCTLQTDSRTVNRNGIFLALRGENHDAHDFLQQAVENGASCLIVDHVPQGMTDSEATMVVVADTQKALGDMAGYRRKQLSTLCRQQVIGITGSCGKTTVKEMVTAILCRKWPAGPDHPHNCVLKTQGNFNNLIGLPLSLLPLSVNNRVAVLEMGMNRPGELQRLGAIADPDISCITNIHAAHLEGLGSIEGVAAAKEELFATTKASGTLIINLDDPMVARLGEKYPHKKITFAASGWQLADKPDLWPSEIFFEKGGVITFTLHYREETVAIHLFTAGEHNVANALAAAALATAAGAGLGEIAAGLGDYRAPAKRMEILESKFGFTVLNDTYNANPGSMAAGLSTLRQLTRQKAVAILGDMRELGASAPQAHFDIGRLLAELDIDHVGIVGDFKHDVEKGALASGLPRERLRLFADKDGVVTWIKEMAAAKKLGKDDLILVKASRGLRFETIVEKLIEEGT